MNNYGNNSLQRNYNSSSSLSQQPFMFGGSYAGSRSSTTFGGQQSVGRRVDNTSVRDCMSWPQSLTPSQNGGVYGGRGQYEGSGQQWGGRVSSMTYQQPQQQTMSYAQPKAFIQLQGGQGEAQPMQIPCQMGPSGGQLGPMSPMEPLTLKVTAPPGAGADGQPIKFQINPYSGLGGRR